MAESFSEKGGLLSQMLACKGQVLGIQSNPPVLEFMGYIMHCVSGKKGLSCFERIYIGYR